SLLRLIFLCAARSHGMETAILEQIALYFELRGGHFPLELGRQARAGPAGKSIGFVITDVADGLILIELAQAGAGELEPLPANFFPVQRRRPALRLHHLPSVGQPQLRPAISAIFNKCKVFAAGHKPRSETESRHQDFMARRFVVEMETARPA